MNQEMIKQKLQTCNHITIFTLIGNLLISTMFLITGWIGKSIAAVSEGIDSFTDAISSLLLLLGFRISSRKPDWLHPNGHQRFEYIIGLLLSELILYASFSLGKKSIALIIHPAKTPFSRFFL